MFRKAVPVLFALFLGGCTLYSEVDVTPLILQPANIERGADLTSMLRKADYLRAMEMGAVLDTRDRKNAAELAALGTAYLAAGRFDDARGRLRGALDLDPFRATYAQVAWNLSQVEYMSNNFDSSLEWAKIAQARGLSIRQWHMDYLESLAGIPAYRFSGADKDALRFEFGRPDVPRVKVRLNRARELEAIIDSGAVLSIVSQRLASSLPVKALGKTEGTFFGLLGEPIPVTFGILDSLELGEIVVENVPVAIMPDDKMKFLVSKREGKHLHMDLLLGSHLLKEFRLELDFSRGRTVFTRLTERRPAADQNLFFEGFRPHVRAAVNRRAWFLFILDTGSEITFINELRLANLPVPALSGMHSATLQGLGGAMKHGTKLEDVEIGIDRWGGKFRTIPMYESSENDVSHGIIGQNFLKNFNVVIDFGRMRVDLVRR